MAMKDLALDKSGDLLFDSSGDFVITDAVRQGVQIKLRWIKGEWIFNPSYGVPYFDTILVKAPSIPQIERVIRDQILSVDGVTGVESLHISVDPATRRMTAAFVALTEEGEIESEVELIRGLWNNR